ncbi:MAG TPA: hypothetical protein DD723_02840 [Candidatus Omnitrophica bacterium]|nr:MAG: hypothetical protein A2Z81_01440 [Omnitrophica WOR_2 bacterium GWA2_45_18]OGX19751.1 MAG: hypothetical protein A2Y04_04265 [Omnitrophica WOR_2 bacterium GWC2_45_7]HBR14464.1 hypothetical protein [Candidatus Omnitrophota bacterium]
MKNLTIGVDVGGTNIKLGLVDSSGKIRDRSFLETKSYSSDKGKLISALADAVLNLLGKNKLTQADVLGVGLGLPGLIDPVRGIVHVLPNIPGWHNVPIKALLEKKTGIPTFIENDVNLITLGEWKFGIGQGCQNLVCITLGTGVGGGLILNNALYRGEGFVAGEIGHMPLNEKGPVCPCGGWGCFERYVGNQTLLAKARKTFKNKNMGIQDVFALANQGHSQALAFWEETATRIGNALVGVVNLLNPRMIIIGGGVANNFKYMGKTIEKIIQQRAMKVQAKMVKIVQARLIDDAGLIGAQVLVQEALGIKS